MWYILSTFACVFTIKVTGVNLLVWTLPALTHAALVPLYWIAAVFSALVMLLQLFCLQERPLQESTKETTPLVPSILRSFRNKAIDALIVAWVLDGLQLAVLVTLFPFYIRYYIQPDGPAAQANGFPFSPTTFIGE